MIEDSTYIARNKSKNPLSCKKYDVQTGEFKDSYKQYKTHKEAEFEVKIII